MHKQLWSINKQEHYSNALYCKTLEQHKNFLLSQQNHYIDEVLTFRTAPIMDSMDNNMFQLIKIKFYEIFTEM